MSLIASLIVNFPLQEKLHESDHLKDIALIPSGKFHNFSNKNSRMFSPVLSFLTSTLDIAVLQVLQ